MVGKLVKGAVISVLEPNDPFGQSFIIIWFLSHEAIGNIATSHDRPPPPNTSSAFHKISLTVNWYPFLLLGGRRLCKRELCSTSKNTTQWPNQVLSLQTSQPGVNPPSDRSLYLLVGLLDSTFFPNSNSGLIKMLLPDKRASPSRRSRSE